jgi:hypothetical protein
MAAHTTDIWGRTALSGDALARWSASAPASIRHHVYVAVPMPSTNPVEKFNGTARRPSEGST